MDRVPNLRQGSVWIGLHAYGKTQIAFPAGIGLPKRQEQMWCRRLQWISGLDVGHDSDYPNRSLIHDYCSVQRRSMGPKSLR